MSSEAAPLPASDLRIAAAAWPIEWHADWNSLAAKLDHWVSQAAHAGAHIAVLPEYAGLGATFIGERTPADVTSWCNIAATSAGRYVALCASLAQRHGISLLTGSLPVRSASHLVNRSYYCQRDGRVSAHDKQILTPWERSDTPLSPGRPLQIVEHDALRIGILICYDSEFPPLARAIAPDILLIPSCTEAAHGDTRVRIGARARALEAQSISVHATLVGEIPECEIVDSNTGIAGIYGPPDHGFPPDGILAQGERDTPGWVYATIPMGILSETRTTGAVAPRVHMNEAEDRAIAVFSRPINTIAP